ncbi:MAG: hypothetical protein LC808_32205 [Actinobacteria bacterium]|nr:hypothetical protein [Actinomycetota bacterium]
MTWPYNTVRAGFVRHLLLVLMLALVSSAAAAATAQAASVVYVKDGNVWLAGLDGSGQYQVTLDGSVSNPYTSPSQADDGTIVAARAKELYRMKQNGELLNAPFGTASPFGAIINPRVSPDGTKVGFSFVTVVSGFQTKRVTLYTYSDRFTDASVFGRQDSLRFSSWITNTRVLGHFGTQAIFDDIGGATTPTPTGFSSPTTAPAQP